MVDMTGKPLLCDSELREHLAPMIPNIQNTRWSAPELLERDDPIPTTASDVYAYAITSHVSFNTCARHC